jgi:hypothetical protein
MLLPAPQADRHISAYLRNTTLVIGKSVVAAIRTMPSRQLAQLHFNDVTMAGTLTDDEV